MRDFLFSCGVVEDEDRPKNHALKPVVCREDELAPAVKQPECPRCSGVLVDDLWTGLCLACHRHVVENRRKKQNLKDARIARKKAAAPPTQPPERRERIASGLCAHCGTRKRARLSSYCSQRSCREQTS